MAAGIPCTCEEGAPVEDGGCSVTSSRDCGFYVVDNLSDFVFLTDIVLNFITGVKTPLGE